MGVAVRDYTDVLSLTNTGYKERSNKMLQQGLGLKRSQVTRDQGTLGGGGKDRMVSPEKSIRMGSGTVN